MPLNQIKFSAICWTTLRSVSLSSDIPHFPTSTFLTDPQFDQPLSLAMAEVEGPTANTSGTQPNPTQDESSLPTPPADPYFPPSSLADTGLSKRPRDARLLHMVLASYGVTPYQERVPLQLMDFAYRYTSSTLSDALHFSSEGFDHTGSGGGKGAASNTLSDITAPALRLSIHSRTHYQYNPVLPTAVYAEIAQERNRVALPPLRKEMGMMLPPEQYCLTGTGFQMEEEEAEEEVADDDTTMKDDEVNGDDGEGGDEPEGGRMEDIFGEQVNGDDGADGMEED